MLKTHAARPLGTYQLCTAPTYSPRREIHAFIGQLSRRINCLSARQSLIGSPQPPTYLDWSDLP
ncbi:hypothetical protein DSO57_1008650 [Entomophthora muscae]|uniref:Uncharacterized protein n=1 Tax=Entomophthora muscae TaxID=34485 RepID=A0ACC2SK36_9FUNG|nr:hypothetical protein DSO57_1008650 [Entomophthora muscae]